MDVHAPSDPQTMTAGIGWSTVALVALFFAPGARGLQAQMLYWAAVNEGPEYVIRRSALDGSNVVDVVDGVSDDIRGLAIDAEARKLYWVERGATESRIVRGGLEGEDRKIVHRTPDFLERIALDPPAETIYFTFAGSLAGAGIGRVSYSGGEAPSLLPVEAGDLAVDSEHGWIFWVEEGQPGVWGTDIWRAALDGSNPIPLIHHEFEHHTTGILVDPPNGRLYWATVDYKSTHAQVVARADIDGSNIEGVTTANPGLDDWPVFLDLDRDSDSIYWVNGEDGVFFRVSFDGGEAERLHEDSGPYGPFDLAILPISEEPAMFRRGDANADRTVDLSDAVVTLTDLFLGTRQVLCQKAADTNDDGQVDVSDAVFLLSYLFLGREPPNDPNGDCGIDPTPDALSCGIAESCR